VSEVASVQIAASDDYDRRNKLDRTARLMTVALVALLVWLPLQTPVAIAVFQYGHSETLARATLLLKDVSVALLILYALASTWRSIKLRWFDKVAIGYLLVIAVYSTVPWLLGSHQTFTAVATAVREFALPVEAYALGRLAYLAGADLKLIFKVFVATSAVVAAISVIEYYLLPITFWSSTLDLVTFERVVQQVSGAHSLRSISLLGDYGAGHKIWPRAIGTFTHPVGTGEYFILPLGLSVAAWFSGMARGRRLTTVGLIGLSLLFAMAEIVTISRGHWIAAALVVLVCGVMFQRLRLAFVCLVIVGIFLAGVPPFSYSIASALNRTDSSALGHISAIGRDVQASIQNIFGVGLGSAEQIIFTGPGSTGPTSPVSGGDSAGLGENLYLSTLLSTGPVGVAAFIAWSLALIALLLRAARQSAQKWLVAGTAAALIGSLAAAMSSAALIRFTTAGSEWLMLGLATGLVLAVSPRAPSLALPARLARRFRRESQA
jgi:O-antigen ligase